MVSIQSASGTNLLYIDVDKIKIVNPYMMTTGFNPQNTGNYATQVCATSTSATGMQYQAQISNYYKEKIGLDNVLFFYNFNNTLTSVAYVGLWTLNGNTTNTVTNGNLVINSANSGSAGFYTELTSRKTFNKFPGYAMSFETRLRISSPATIVDKHIVFGLISPIYNTGVNLNQTLYNGIFFRYRPDGTLWVTRSMPRPTGTAVSQNANTDQTYKITPPSLNAFHTYRIVLNEIDILFYVDNIVVYQMFLSEKITTAPQTTYSIFYLYTILYANTSPNVQLLLNYCTVSQNEMDNNKSWGTMMVESGGRIDQGQLNEASQCNNNMVGNNVSWSAPAGTVLNNSAGISDVNLGGLFSIQPNLAVPNDGVIWSYKRIGGKNMYITSIFIQSWMSTLVTGGVATNSFIFVYSLAFGGNTTNLALQDSTSAKGARRIILGMETYNHGTAVVGTIGTVNSNTNTLLPVGISYYFNTPVLVQNAEYVQLVVKNIGTAAATGVISGDYSVNGYCE